MESYIIRPAQEKDAKAVHDIYGAYVNEDNVTFTENNPDVDAYREKIARTMKTYPFYVAEDKNGRILGYVHGSPLRPHDAYRWNVESTIMLAPDAPRREGIATALYNRFIDTLKRQGFCFVYGVLVDNNTASIALHKALGFINAGHFKNAGCKNGKWRGIIWMQKQIGELTDNPKEPIPFEKLIKEESKT